MRSLIRRRADLEVPREPSVVGIDGSYQDPQIDIYGSVRSGCGRCRRYSQGGSAPFAGALPPFLGQLRSAQ